MYKQRRLSFIKGKQESQSERYGRKGWILMAKAPSCRDCKYYYENCDLPWPVCELNEFHFEGDYTICGQFELKYGSSTSSKSSGTSRTSSASARPKAARSSSPLGGILLLVVIVLVAVIAVMALFGRNVEGGPEPGPAPPEESVQPDSPSGSGYLLPTDTEYISEADLSGFTREEVTLIRNELFARHGYNFSSQSIRAYFEAQSWYEPVPGVDASSFDPAVFNEYEVKNLATILAFEQSMGWRS